MNRLTNNSGKDYQVIDKDDLLIIAEGSLFKPCINKLGQLEDFEEELGFDLITLLKALMNGIYVVDDGEILEETISGIERFNDGWGFSTYYNDFELTFSEYGKYWALTREELEVN